MKAPVMIATPVLGVEDSKRIRQQVQREMSQERKRQLDEDIKLLKRAMNRSING